MAGFLLVPLSIFGILLEDYCFNFEAYKAIQFAKSVPFVCERRVILASSLSSPMLSSDPML